jgi:hypothetical protein
VSGTAQKASAAKDGRPSQATSVQARDESELRERPNHFKGTGEAGAQCLQMPTAHLTVLLAEITIMLRCIVIRSEATGSWQGIEARHH